jgi:hypothetical protein
MAIGIWQARRPGAALLWLGACGAIAVHAAAGHAAAGRLPVASTVIVHTVHVVAAGAWLGGLVVLIAGLREPSVDRHRTIRRFSNLAAAGLALVTLTGVARTIHEVGGWNDFNNTYGGLVVAKVALLIAIAALGAVNRWRHVPAAATDAGPLRRVARAEIALAALAIVAAGSLATLPPPAAANTLAGIEATGADFATTVRATLTAVSDQPGPNRFNVAVEDYDSGEPISPDRVSLMFTPIDDRGVPTTTLALARAADGVFTGTGANLSLDGRWRVDVRVERGNTSADVPLEIEARGPPQRVSVLREPSKPAVYGINVARVGTVAVVVDPERPGPAQLRISCHGFTTDPYPVRDMVVTIASDEIPVQTLVIRRENRHQFTAAATLRRGTNRISVVARTESGARIRTTFEVVLADRD